MKSTINRLGKAELEKPEMSLNIGGYSGLFTARGEMIRASDSAFIEGKIDYTHVVCWKVPFDEPFVGVNADELRSELTMKVMGGYLEEDDRGKSLEDPSLLNLIMADVSKWCRGVISDKGEDYFVRDFREVYDFKYSVAARLANTSVLLEVSYL